MNQNRLLFIQIETLPPSGHYKWKEIICKTTNKNSYGTSSQQNAHWVKRKLQRASRSQEVAASEHAPLFILYVTQPMKIIRSHHWTKSDIVFKDRSYTLKTWQDLCLSPDCDNVVIILNRNQSTEHLAGNSLTCWSYKYAWLRFYNLGTITTMLIIIVPN